MIIPTEEAICNALEELLQSNSMDKISVRMVCEKAGISRQALYNHYYGLIGVLEDLLTQRFKHAVGDHSTYLTWELDFEHILTCMREHRVMILHVYNSNSRSELLNIFERYGSTLVSRAISQCAADMAVEVSDKDLVYLMRIYMYVFIGVLDRWMEFDLHLTPGYIASRCNAVLALSIRNALRRLTNSEGRPLQMPEKVNQVVDIEPSE